MVCMSNKTILCNQSVYYMMNLPHVLTKAATNFESVKTFENETGGCDAKERPRREQWKQLNKRFQKA